MPKVYNISSECPTNAIYVGRTTDFGNPFSVSHFGRAEAISRFEKLVNNNAAFKEQIIKELKGKDLICHCKPLPCHADILLKIANKEG